jgi:VIT1/CCC1 family predicted Fe2+/Mn2+ transporter
VSITLTFDFITTVVTVGLMAFVVGVYIGRSTMLAPWPRS